MLLPKLISMKRIQSFDLARGFTVLIMPSIHVVMLYSQLTVQQSLLGDILGFIAEGPGAQLFMLLMGVSFTFSKKNNPRYIVQRAFSLLIAAYLLNFFKFLVPLGLGLMPANLLQELQLKNDFTAAVFFLLIGDILHFAAIAYLVLFFIYRLKYYHCWSFVIAIAILLGSSLVWDLHTGIVFLDYLLQLLGGHPPTVFFPVFPWLAFPLMGLTLGYLLKECNQNRLMKNTGLSGAGIVIIACLFPPTVHSNDWLPFYRTDAADTLFHLGFVLTWLSVFHWLSKEIPANFFYRLLTFCSKNITTIYIIQWVFICWCLVFTGYMQLNMTSTLIWMIGITTITLLLTHALNNAYRKSI